jgi:hypothetical protein
MKNRNFKIGALLVSLFAASCSPALYQSGAYNIDDMYAEHDVTRIAQEKQAIAEARKAEAEARRAEIEARQAEAAYYASDDSYQGVLADTYESAYARRLRGFSSPTYQMPTSYFNLRYNGTYQFVSAYDPAVYNIIVMGDEVWVEPKYITSMFGTWGSPSIVSFGWSAGLYNDWYFSWGYNPYPWAYPGFGWPYYSYNPYWGYPYWGGYYPYWGYYPGWGGGHHHHPYDQRLQKRHHDRQRQLPGRQDQQQFQFQLPRRLIVSQSRQLHLPESLFRRQQQLLPGKQFDTE